MLMMPEVYGCTAPAVKKLFLLCSPRPNSSAAHTNSSSKVRRAEDNTTQ